MIIGFLYTIYVLLCFLLIFIVLLQRSKGSLGLAGSFGGSTQALFGGSGGQDFFQKVTWIFIGSFMIGSLLLALLKNRSVNQSRYLDSSFVEMPVMPMGSSQDLTQPVPPDAASTESAASSESSSADSSAR